MSKTFTSLLLASVFATAAGPALAQAGKTPLPPTRTEIVNTLGARFKSVDTNGDGSLNKAEIDAANSRAAGNAEAELMKKVEAEFAKRDTNKDGMISLSEFKAAAPDAKAVPADAALQRLDSNKDQKVSLTEFSTATLAAFDRIDMNKDGRISETEREAAKRPGR